jgi:molybdopterin-guanine dinucleotide biosynthesis protein A
MTQTEYAHIPVSAVILAGGAARRMGGQDKGLLDLNGRPLVAHVIEHLRPQCDTLLINCNRNEEAYAHFGCPLISDSLPGGLGPLAGLLSAMEHSTTPLVLSIPCDTPFLPLDLATRMVAEMQQSEADVCTVSDGDRLHPVILLARTDLKQALREQLLAGERKVHHWFYQQQHCVADFSDQPTAFANINTPQQLEDAARQTR